MIELFDIKYGVAGLCVLVTLYILLEVGKFVWSLKAHKDTASEKTLIELVDTVREFRQTAEHLERRMADLEKALGEVPKLKLDLRRFYTAVKIIAGDKWPAIRKEMDDDLIL